MNNNEIIIFYTIFQSHCFNRGANRRHRKPNTVLQPGSRRGRGRAGGGGRPGPRSLRRRGTPRSSRRDSILARFSKRSSAPEAEDQPIEADAT